MLQLKDIMTTDIAAATPNMTLREAMELLSENHISGAPVLDGGKVVGIFSATDLLEFIAELDAAQPSVSFRRRETPLEEVTVSEVMTRTIRSLPPDTAVTLAGAFMRQAQIHRLLVMQNGRLVGIATTTDFAKAFSEHCVERPVPQPAPPKGTMLEAVFQIDPGCCITE